MREITGVSGVPVGLPGEFEKTCLPDRGEPLVPDLVTQKIFDDMRGEDAEQKPSTSQKGETKP